MAQTNGICTALFLSDSRPCKEATISSDGLFCSHHAKQCYGLYRGYKIRNAQLDYLSKHPPPLLAESASALRNETFHSVDDEETLKSVHDYLLKRLQLLTRVIKARGLHHAHFYSLNLDYGHRNYLDKLLNTRRAVVHALEKLERRTAEVLYAQQKWFEWVREQQDEEDAAGMQESERVKREAKLFRRHWKELEAQRREKRKREEAKRSDEALEEAYQQRLTESSASEDDEAAYDPIEDIVQDERESYAGLIRNLLWLQQRDLDDITPEPAEKPEQSSTAGQNDGKENVDPNALAGKSKNARKRIKAKAKAKETSQAEEAADDAVRVEVNESREDMRKRLTEGVVYDFREGIRGGTLISGTMISPHESFGKVPGMPTEEVDKILAEVEEIKSLLFCRLLLAHATLLPAALRAGSIEAFLADEDVKTADVRELCLKLEQPTLQQIRDACADFFRPEDESDDSSEVEAEDEEEEDPKLKNLAKLSHSHVPDIWRSKQEKAISEQQSMPPIQDGTQTMIDFGQMDETGKFHKRKIRVKVAGK